MRKHYLNLTNGLEDWDGTQSVIRIQSSHCEQRDWEKILGGLDSDLLFNLAIGTNCVIHDYSQKREISRAVWQGMKFVEYVLNRVWFNREIRVKVGRDTGRDCTAYFRGEYHGIPKWLRLRLKYYRKFLTTDKLNISYVGGRTPNDGDYDYFARKIKNNL